MNLAWRQVQGEFTAANASDVKFVNNIAAPLDKTVFGISNFQTTRITWDSTGRRWRTPYACGVRNGAGAAQRRENGGVDFVAPSVDPKTADFHRGRAVARRAPAVSTTRPFRTFRGLFDLTRGRSTLGLLQASGTGAAAIRN